LLNQIKGCVTSVNKSNNKSKSKGDYLMKKYSLVLFMLILVGLFNLNVFAQKVETVKTEQPNAKCSSKPFVIPQSIPIKNKALQNFIRIASLPSAKRPKEFSALYNEEKVGVYKMQLALQFLKYPDLTKQQKDLILETISNTSTETYDKENPEKIAKADRVAQDLEDKALVIFTPNMVYSIFSSIDATKADIEMMQKYEDILLIPSMSLRRKNFRESSSLNKSLLWKSQLVYYLATSKLNKIQQDFFIEMISLSSQSAFDIPSRPNEIRNDDVKKMDALMDALEEKSFKLFTKEEIFSYFMSLGIHQLPKPNPNENVRLSETDCDCRWWCGPCKSCTSSSCSETLSGCGLTLRKPCTSLCEVNLSACTGPKDESEGSDY
jgi:hypothetical protein